MTLDDVRWAVQRLSRTSRGRSAMRHVLAWLEDDGLGLDCRNQADILTVLQGAWGAWPGSVREFMREQLEPSGIER